MSNIIKGFFFDLDGTLVNTYEADYLAYRDAIKDAIGIDTAREAFMKTNGMEMRHKLGILVPGIPQHLVEQIAQGKKKHYSKYLHLTTPNDGLVSFLSSTIKDHTIALVTTAKRQNALLVLEAHGIMQYFSEMVFGDDVSLPKPDPESYLLALKKTKLHPEEVVAFEDSQSGMESAMAAGISVIRIKSF